MVVIAALNIGKFVLFMDVRVDLYPCTVSPIDNTPYE